MSLSPVTVCGPEMRTRDAVISPPCTPVVGQFQLGLGSDEAPRSLVARVERDGEMVFETSREPDYQVFRPAGEDCPPTCREAQLELQMRD